MADEFEFEADYFHQIEPGKICPIAQLEQLLADCSTFEQALETIRAESGVEIVSDGDTSVQALCTRNKTLEELAGDAYTHCGFIILSRISF